MMFLVNRNTGRSTEWNGALENVALPTKNFFDHSGFASPGQVVELVLVKEEEQTYFGVKYRRDVFKVLARGILRSYGVDPL